MMGQVTRGQLDFENKAIRYGHLGEADETEQEEDRRLGRVLNKTRLSDAERFFYFDMLSPHGESDYDGACFGY